MFSLLRLKQFVKHNIRAIINKANNVMYVLFLLLYTTITTNDNYLLFILLKIIYK